MQNFKPNDRYAGTDQAHGIIQAIYLVEGYSFNIWLSNGQPLTIKLFSKTPILIHLFIGTESMMASFYIHLISSFICFE